ncbi:hypothetical protein [Leadbettera azotonutricia]|uniref:Uncharacterized protein n=1 Tax=Leadbettera azotonutricia (strain ATCC BAA-888 / DSM 13862 / ZAS-9) TaxID=545695 RepID=F5Y6T7_LEAAZ|nr:hypothetical protein [Leadbettera azotonutricia]AEF81092.1 conserved hypothetical protein [Leadbettera azotonutricia ZAS-9]
MNKSIGVFVLNIATALYLLATGIIGLAGRSWKNIAGGEIRQAVEGIFKRGNLREILIVVLAIAAIAAAAFILLRLFGIEVAITELLLIILMIVWLVFIILIDIIPLFDGKNFVDFLRSIGAHLMVLGGMALATEKFGG